MMRNELLDNLDRLHSTEMGYERLKRNLGLDSDIPAILEWCKSHIHSADNIEKRGKNWYVSSEGSIITINAKSYTIITAHTQKKKSVV